jgi:Xaa-Pro aminopeptidase
MTNQVKFIYDSGKDPEMFYAIGERFSDPFFLIDLGKSKKLFLDHRELKAFEEKNSQPQLEAVALEPFLEKASHENLAGSFREKLAFLVLKEHSLLDQELLVPDGFPLSLADFLRKQGIKLKPQSLLYPQRQVKNDQEIEHVRASVKGNLLAFAKIKEVLESSQIKKDQLVFEGQILTSELLKELIEEIFWKNNLELPEGIIVSSGYQSALPHHEGRGEIKPHQPIICDIFPRHRKSRYFSDITRTFVKGSPTKELQKIYDAVKKTQERVIGQIKPGISAEVLHEEAKESFLSLGYHVGEKGFTHSTGHGIGLEAHEGPYITKNSPDILEPGNIFTVEPGLYYPELGGVRIEDNILITKTGFEILTEYPKDLVIK